MHAPTLRASFVVLGVALYAIIACGPVKQKTFDASPTPPQPIKKVDGKDSAEIINNALYQAFGSCGKGDISFGALKARPTVLAKTPEGFPIVAEPIIYLKKNGHFVLDYREYLILTNNTIGSLPLDSGAKRTLIHQQDLEYPWSIEQSSVNVSGLLTGRPTQADPIVIAIKFERALSTRTLEKHEILFDFAHLSEGALGMNAKIYCDMLTKNPKRDPLLP